MSGDRQELTYSPSFDRILRKALISAAIHIDRAQSNSYAFKDFGKEKVGVLHQVARRSREPLILMLFLPINSEQ